MKQIKRMKFSAKSTSIGAFQEGWSNEELWVYFEAITELRVGSIQTFTVGFIFQV